MIAGHPAVVATVLTEEAAPVVHQVEATDDLRADHLTGAVVVLPVEDRKAQRDRVAEAVVRATVAQEPGLDHQARAAADAAGRAATGNEVPQKKRENGTDD